MEPHPLFAAFIGAAKEHRKRRFARMEAVSDEAQTEAPVLSEPRA